MTRFGFKKVLRISVLLGFALLLSATAFAAGGQEEGQDIVVTQTTGPQGEAPTWYSDVTLTEAEKQQVRAGNYRAAFLLHTSSDFTNALLAGARAAFEDLNIELVLTSDSEMDPTKQRSDVETALARDPDIILTLVIDPVAGAAAFRPAVDAGVQLVFMSNLPEGYVQGEDYVAIVTDDLFGMGKAAAELLADSMGGSGDVAWLYHDASYYVTNQRDNAFKYVIENEYPGMNIVVERGIANPADAETIASAILTQYPSVEGIYVPWDTPAEGVVAAARAAGRDDLKIVTLDFGATNALDLAQGGNMVGIVADLAWDLGNTMATLGVYGVLNKRAPGFVIVPAIKATAENLPEQWRASLGQDPPREIMRLY